MQHPKAELTKDTITLPVYHPTKDKWDTWTLTFKRNITFRNKPTFRKYIEKQIKEKYNENEELLATNTYLSLPQIYSDAKGKYKICVSNLKDNLLFAGVLFNSHASIYDDFIYESEKEFDKQFIADALMVAMCYITNKTTEGFSIFSEKELGLPHHSLKAMPNGEMFYDFMNKYKSDLSKEGHDLREKTLAMYHWYFKQFGVNANKNVSLAELKLAIMQNKVNVSFEKATHKLGVTGRGGNTRKGENSKWTPTKADRLHNTHIFTDYDKALLKLQTKMYERFIEYGMIDEMPKNVR